MTAPIQRLLHEAAVSIYQLEELRELLKDMNFECDAEKHTLNGKRLLVVNEDGRLSATGTGYFAWPDGRRINKRTKGWPGGHRAEPCGECWGCQVVSLGIGFLSIHDGRGHREVRL